MPTETVLDIVLDVPENFHRKVCIEVLSKVVAANTWFVSYSGLKLSQDFQNTEKLEVFYKSSLSAFINAVMKAAVPQSWRPLHASLLKAALCQRYFLKNFTRGAEQRYWKIMHQDDCFWGQLYFRNIPQWLLFKDSCKDIFILEILG